MSLEKKIIEILDGGDDYRKGDYCKVSKITRGYQLEYGAMYSAPQLSFKKLLALSELFGTDGIDVDDYGSSGCDTCDYGSDYGHTIQIYEPTKNVNEINKLVGTDLKKVD